MRSLKIVMKCSPGRGVEANKNEMLQYDSSHSYIIIGEHSENTWAELVERMIEKGALKFIVVLEIFSPDSEKPLKDTNFLNKKGIHISFKSSNQINTVEEASNLITEANEIGTLEAIYFISAKSVGKKIRNLDLALQHDDSNKYVRFVSLFSGGLRELESRRSKGLPAILIHGENSQDFINLLPDIDYISTYCNDKDSPTLYQVEEISKTDSKPAASTLRDYLPNSLETLGKIGGYNYEIPMFVERTSLSPRYSEVRGVSPIFIIPSLHGDLLDPLIKKLIYPVYCSMLPATTFSITDVAKILYQNINKIQPTGPVTIIGETWNACLSIELSLLVKSVGRKYRLFLLEGNPLKWKELFTSLGDIKSAQFQNNLLRDVFDFNQTHDNKELKSVSRVSFEDHVQKYLSTFMLNGVGREFLIRAANIIRNRVLNVLQHEQKDCVLHNTTLLTQYFSKNSSLKLSVSSNVVIIEETSYENFLQNAEVISTLNENAAFSWWA